MKAEVNLLIKRLEKKGLTLAMAESITCGLASHKLANGKDVSKVFAGAIVCYSPDVKTALLGIPQKLISTYTCESMEVTAAMAKKLPRLIKADVHAAVTGLASPGGSETKEKPVGTVFFCIQYRNKMYKATRRFKGSPLKVKKKACEELYRFLIRTME